MGRSRMVMFIREKNALRCGAMRPRRFAARLLTCQGRILTRLDVDSGFSTLVEDSRSQIPRWVAGDSWLMEKSTSQTLCIPGTRLKTARLPERAERGNGTDGGI